MEPNFENNLPRPSQSDSSDEESRNESCSLSGAGNEITVAEYQNQPKYVPRDADPKNIDSNGPMILRRGATLTRA